jgi:hypothetical protein
MQHSMGIAAARPDLKMPLTLCPFSDIENV